MYAIKDFFRIFMLHPRMKRQPSAAPAFLPVLMLLFPLLVAGQGRNQEVTIIAPYQPTISEAYKIQFRPRLSDSAIEMPHLDYNIRSQVFATEYASDMLKPVFIEPTSDELLRRNYLKAGYGNYSMPYVELFSNSLASEDFSLGFHARHLSSQGEIEDYATSSFSHNKISLFGKRYLKNKVFSANVFFKRDVVHYYGYEPEDYPALELSDEDLKQRFSQIGFNTGLASNYRRGGKMNYKLALDFYHLNDLYESSETYFALKGNVNSSNEFLDFVERQELGLDYDLAYFNNQDSLMSQGNILASLKPYIKLHFDYLDLQLGIEGALASDSSSSFYVYPAVKASYQVIPDYLRFYVRATGGLQRNSYRFVSNENPWVNPVFPLGNTSTNYEIKAGISGRLDILLDYEFSVSYADVKNMMFFVNDFESAFSPDQMIVLGNKFTAVYDDVQLTTISIQAGYEQIDKMNIYFSARYDDYTLSNEEKPWHKPAFSASLTGRYFISPRFSLAGELAFQSKVYARTLDDGSDYSISKRDAFADLSLEAEYRFSDRVSAFARFYNLTATRYYRWYNYPSQRINVMGGLTFSF